MEPTSKRRAYIKRPDENLIDVCAMSEEWCTNRINGSCALSEKQSALNNLSSAGSRAEQRAKVRSHVCSFSGVMGEERKKYCSQGKVRIVRTFPSPIPFLTTESPLSGALTKISGAWERGVLSCAIHYDRRLVCSP